MSRQTNVLCDQRSNIALSIYQVIILTKINDDQVLKFAGFHRLISQGKR